MATLYCTNSKQRTRRVYKRRKQSNDDRRKKKSRFRNKPTKSRPSRFKTHTPQGRNSPHCTSLLYTERVRSVQHLQPFHANQATRIAHLWLRRDRDRDVERQHCGGGRNCDRGKRGRQRRRRHTATRTRTNAATTAPLGCGVNTAERYHRASRHWSHRRCGEGDGDGRRNSVGETERERVRNRARKVAVATAAARAHTHHEQRAIALVVVVVFHAATAAATVPRIHVLVVARNKARVRVKE